MTGRKMQGGIAVVLALVLACAATLPGCGSHTAAPAAPQGNSGGMLDPANGVTRDQRIALRRNFAHVLPPQAYAALSGLAAPVAQPRSSSARQTSAVLPLNFNANQQYSVPLGAGWIQHSSDATFQPGSPPGGHASLAPPGAGYPANFGYIIYRVDAVTQTPRTLTLHFGSSTGEAGVVVYNWAYGSQGRWEPRFFGTASGDVDIALDDLAGADWTDGNDNLAFTVFCLNPAAVTLNSFGLSDVSTDQAPFASVSLSSCHGPAPAQITLDASASFDSDGSIVDYKFDPLGHNDWTDNGSNPVFQYIYTDPGPYTPRVEVTDNQGETDKATAETMIVEPGSFDEVEDNDNNAEANALTLPFSFFAGNVGSGGAYDGDQEDWYSFDASVGDELQFTAKYCLGGPSQWLGMAMYDNAGNVLAQSEFSQTPPCILYHVVQPGDSGPFHLHVVNYSATPHTYYLSGGPQIDETEDDDSAEEAALQLRDLWQLTATKALNGWHGSLGTGPAYDGYDGDDDDWYYYRVPQGSTLHLTMTYDNGTGNLGVSLFNQDGGLLANSATGSGSEQIDYTQQDGDGCLFFVHFAALSGYSDYSVNATLDTSNSGFYDETEDNDTRAAAQAVPSFPFTGFEGNVGWNGANDGDPIDYYSFGGNNGDLIEFDITPAVAGPSNIRAVIQDANGAQLAVGANDSQSGLQQIGVLVTSTHPQPYYLQVTNYQYCVPEDYSLDGAVVTAYLEQEDNDVPAQANSISPQPFYFAGSLGAPGYDGDLSDWLTFTAQAGEQPSFNVQFDDTTGVFDFVNDAPQIWDSQNDVVADSFETAPGLFSLTFAKPIGPGDISPFLIKLNLSAGNTKYWINRVQ